MSATLVKPAPELPRLAEYHQRQAAKQAIGREIARMVEPSDELLDARVRLDEAMSHYRDVVREEARKALDKYS